MNLLRDSRRAAERQIRGFEEQFRNRGCLNRRQLGVDGREADERTNGRKTNEIGGLIVWSPTLRDLHSFTRSSLLGNDYKRRPGRPRSPPGRQQRPLLDDGTRAADSKTTASRSEANKPQDFLLELIALPPTRRRRIDRRIDRRVTHANANASRSCVTRRRRRRLTFKERKATSFVSAGSSIESNRCASLIRRTHVASRIFRSENKRKT